MKHVTSIEPLLKQKQQVLLPFNRIHMEFLLFIVLHLVLASPGNFTKRHHIATMPGVNLVPTSPRPKRGQDSLDKNQEKHQNMFKLFE